MQHDGLRNETDTYELIYLGVLVNWQGVAPHDHRNGVVYSATQCLNRVHMHRLSCLAFTTSNGYEVPS